MYKTVISVCVVLMLALTMAGCACKGTATTTPTPTVKPVATPMTSAGVTPGLATTPGAAASPGASVSPGTSGAIPNFSEGTEVNASDVPNVQQAITAKYPNATITSIKHALVNSQQVYAVEIKDGTNTETVYVQPDGTIVEKTGT